METDEKEAKQLLKLASPVRKHAFARMVSWEFSQPSQPCKNRRKKQRVLSVTTDDVNSDEDDVNSDEDCVARDTGDGAESDEYYTADEEVSSVSGEELEMEEEEVSLEGLTLSDVPLPKSERHGGRSKSQKRRRKRIYRQNQLDFFAPFANDEGDMIEAVQAEDLKPVKNVPTLMEICLKACSQGNSGPLPILKQHKDELKHRRALHSQQLKWLHRILLINEKGFDPERVTFEKVGRCVFQEGYERKDLDDFFSRHMQFDALKSLMLKHSCNDLSANEKIAVLAHVIDLMLPSTFRCKRSPSVTEDEDDILRKARQTAVIKVKIALKARYPRFVEHLFNISLAYVWWARGHLGQASELLFQAADQVKTKTTPAHKDSTERRSNHLHLQKAMYMNDAGLMYAVFGDPVAAAKCYRQAAEVSCTGFQSGVQDDVVLQSMILMAAAWDQGLMNKKSSVNSASAWNAVVASPADCPLEAVYAAVEAFLCFHAGYSTDSSNLSQEEENKAWLIEAKEKLEKLMKTFQEASVLKLYYSFVLAMLGNGYDSIQALRLFTSSCDPASYPQGFPARQVRQATKASVFQPLVDIAKETHRPVPVMPLLWRRQLVHPIISKTSHSLLADKQSVPLNLHITDEGYLTGDMYLNLPPMRGVLLDPYTGSVCIPHTPSVSQPWNSLPDFTIRCYEDHLPIPVQIYKDPSRHLTVDMVNVVHYENNHWSNQGIYLHWRDPNRNYKLNLRNVVKKVMKEEILKHAKSEVVSQGTSEKGLTSSDYEEGAKKLEEHYQRGWIFHYSHIFGYGRKQCSCGEKKTKRKRYTYPVSMFNICIKKLVRFGPASVLFMLNTVKTDTVTADTLVFLDMTSLETFVNPVVHYVGASSDRFFQLETVPATDNSIEPQHQYVNVIGVTRIDEKGGCLRLHSYDEQGKHIDERKVKEPYKEDPILLTNGTMSQFYGLRREVEGDGNESEMSTVSLWDMKTKRHQKSVSLFQPKQLVGAYNTIFVRTETALVVLDSSTMLSVDVTFDRPCEMPEQTALWLNKELHNISVLASRKITRVTPQGENVELYRMVFTADNKVYLLDRPCLNSDDAQAPLNVTTEVVIAGRATEACYISEQVGFVIVVTLNEKTDMNYRNHLYWYSTRGELRGVLPFLGKGPHSLYSVYLSGDENQAETEGWYLYFTDGYGAICCIKLL